MTMHAPLRCAMIRHDDAASQLHTGRSRRRERDGPPPGRKRRYAARAPPAAASNRQAAISPPPRGEPRMIFAGLRRRWHFRFAAALARSLENALAAEPRAMYMRRYGAARYFTPRRRPSLVAALFRESNFSPRDETPRREARRAISLRREYFPRATTLPISLGHYTLRQPFSWLYQCERISYTQAEYAYGHGHYTFYKTDIYYFRSIDASYDADCAACSPPFGQPPRLSGSRECSLLVLYAHTSFPPKCRYGRGRSGRNYAATS